MPLGKVMRGILAAGIFAPGIAADVVRHPPHTGMALEYGQLFHTINVSQPDAKFIRKFTIKRPTGWFFQGATLHERVDVVAGIGATFFVLYPDEGQAFQHVQIPGLALAQASASYAWGDVKNPAAKLSLGFMPYKYNADARNLGEYLFRSTPYPSTIVNSSFNLVDGAQAKITGAVLSGKSWSGKWKNDLVLASSDVYPLHDLSLAWVSSLRVHPVLEIGAGINLFHLVAMDDKPFRKISNAYISHQGEELSAYSTYYRAAALNQTGADSLRSDSLARLVDSLVPDPAINPGSVPLVPLSYFQVGGTLLMGRFSLDLRPWLGGKADLGLYGEIAMLGVKDYPVFYGNKADRMPMMLGLRVPTFGVLDLLGAEVEFWKNPHLNSSYSLSSAGAVYGAIPDFAGARNMKLDPMKPYTRDDFAWSCTAAKTVAKSIQLSVKVARDHLTQFNFADTFPREVQADIFQDNRGWYYLFRVQTAI